MSAEAKRTYNPNTKTGTGIFDNDCLREAKDLENYIGRFVKVKIKSNGFTLEREITAVLIKAVQRGQIQILTVLRG